MFKKCLVVGCGRIAWLDSICSKCQTEANQIMTRIGRSRNSGNRKIIGPLDFSKGANK